MDVNSNRIVSTKNIPEDSWYTWLRMGYDDPLCYLIEEYNAKEIPYDFCEDKFWRSVRFHSDELYTEFCLRWL